MGRKNEKETYVFRLVVRGSRERDLEYSECDERVERGGKGTHGESEDVKRMYGSLGEWREEG